MSVQKVSSYVIWRIEAFIEEDTRNIVHRTMMPKSPSKSAPWDLIEVSQRLFHYVNTAKNPLLELPPAAPLYFPESHWWSEISSLSKLILVWGKARSHRAPNLSCREGLNHLGDLKFHQKTARDMIYEWVHCCDAAAKHQLPIAVAVYNCLSHWWRPLR